MTFTLTQEEYEALVAFARVGAAGDSSKTIALDQFLKSIERNNNVTRYFLWIQWQEKSAPLPAGTRFPEVWPERQRKYIELISRPIAKVDVQAVLDAYANDPVEVLVTPDPNGLVGWTPIDSYFIT